MKKRKFKNSSMFLASSIISNGSRLVCAYCGGKWGEECNERQCKELKKKKVKGD